MEIDFEKLQFFYYLCKFQSFSKVAKEFGIDQSTISRNIKTLERSLGKELVLNSQKPIVLSEYGKELFAMAESIDSEMLHLEKNFIDRDFDFAYSQFRLQLSLPTHFGFLFSHGVHRFLKDFPEILLDISFDTNITFNLLNKRDLIIINQPYNHIFVENKYIGTYEIVFAANLNYLKQFGRPLSIHDLKYHNFVYIKDFDYPALAANEEQREVLKNLSQKYLFDNEVGGIKAIEAGCGIGIIPLFILKDLKNTVQIIMPQKFKTLEIYAATSKIRKNSHVEIIVNFFKDLLENERRNFGDY